MLACTLRARRRYVDAPRGSSPSLVAAAEAGAEPAEVEVLAVVPGGCAGCAACNLPWGLLSVRRMYVLALACLRRPVASPAGRWPCMLGNMSVRARPECCFGCLSAGTNPLALTEEEAEVSDEEAEPAQHAQQAGQAQQLGSADSLPGPADEPLPGSPKAADAPAAAAGVASLAPEEAAAFAAEAPPAQPSAGTAAAAQPPPPVQQQAQRQQQQPQALQSSPKPQAPQLAGIAIQSSEDVEAAAAALPSSGTVLFSGRCQWVTPKRVLPGQLQVTNTQMHFIADLAGGSPGISAWLSGPTGGSGGGIGGSRGSSAAQLAEGAEGAASAAPEELPPKRRHRRWQLSGLTEVHHRQVEKGLAH